MMPRLETALTVDWAKRLFEIVVAAVGLTLLAPVLVLIAMAVKLCSPGPVLYRGARVGRGGNSSPC